MGLDHDSSPPSVVLIYIKSGHLSCFDIKSALLKLLEFNDSS